MNSIGRSRRVCVEQVGLRARRRDRQRAPRARCRFLSAGEPPRAPRSRSSRSRGVVATGPRDRHPTSASAPAGNSARCTDDSRVPGSCRQTSSAVIDRIGAKRRASPSAMTYCAVCAERRSTDVRMERVQPILGNVEVERAEIDGDELVDGLKDGLEVVRVVTAPARQPRARANRASMNRSTSSRLAARHLVSRPGSKS